MTAKLKKSTKKFQQRRLGDTLERRKEFSKIKQRHQIAEKRKAKNAGRREKEEAEKVVDPKEQAKDNAFAEMNVDDFFAGGFDIPEQTKGKGKKAQKKDVTPKIGKRKRAEDVAEGGTSASDSAESDADVDVESDGDEQDSDDASNVGDFEAHMGQLEALKDKDPEFYKFLKENDAELLDFGDQGDLAEVDELSEAEEGPAKKKKKSKNEIEADGPDDTKLTTSMVKKWKKAMQEEHSMRALRQIVLAFRSAAYMNEDEADNTKYSISDSAVYHQVLVTALESVPKVLAYHLPVKETAGGKLKLNTESKKFKTLTPLIKSHTSSVHQLLVNLTDPSTLKLTLSSVEPMMPYLLQFRKLLKVLVKTVVGIWSDNSNAEAVRVTGFLIMRRLMKIGDAGIREAVLKATYEGVVKGSRNTTVHTLAGVNLTKNSAAEIWGVDQNVSYTTGFSFIRQLAIHLRGSITNKSKESYKTVYNWQYVHSLDFWSRVLSQHCNGLVEAEAGKQSALRPLIYPVVQITLGAIRLIPTPQYFPLRFQLIRALLRMSRATGTYIPLAPVLLEVLNSNELRKPPKSSTLRAPDFNTSIRAAKSYLRTRVYQDGVGEQVAELLSEFFVLWTKSIAFPELSLPIVVMLKRWLKEVGSRATGNKNSKINQMILLLVQKLELNSRWIEERRAKVTFAPKNRAEVESFLKETDWESTPLGAFVKTQRKLREEKAAVLEQGRQDEEKQRQKERENGSDDDDVEVDSGDDEEEDE
ncbi:putative ribosome assembly protein Noc2 [Talaromyces proteolyticus]|uniref:Ribosome assembly protein Noc2 n=1 Tax=Talaromyces proteolyticus TaxID=1131652 RepID=A0AAD4Q1M4_9EURO|nr:putative ribosome assembly protein Noc2 [Talaromyces proteolyticus]KAH8698640.1 putative ribosome assembly protein Noc2 [Talaromyces proteolyticus]